MLEEIPHRLPNMISADLILVLASFTLIANFKADFCCQFVLLGPFLPSGAVSTFLFFSLLNCRLYQYLNMEDLHSGKHSDRIFIQALSYLPFSKHY